MEELQKKHRQEQRDLQSRLTQKKRSATKKTRKGISDECAQLEKQLKDRHDAEIASLKPNDPFEVGDPNPISISDDDDPAALERSKDISESMNAMSVSSSPAANGHAKRPNRQKARLARRAAELEATIVEAHKEASDLPDLREKERRDMEKAYISRGLKEHEIRSDGHCLYAAVADQLEDSRVSLKPKIEVDITDEETQLKPAMARYKITRQVAAAYISQNPEDFSPFLEEPLDTYVAKIRDTGEWGGHLEILALAKAYGVDINVLQGDGKVENIGCGIHEEPRTLWLAYYHHSFGLGEHYNSLRRTL